MANSGTFNNDYGLFRWSTVPTATMPDGTPLCKHAGEVFLEKAFYQSRGARGALSGKPQRPRWKRVGYFKDEAAARAAAK